jgi:O-6-methylguanine DNA methyltransferase
MVLVLARTRLDTPLGPMFALASPIGLCGLEFVEPRRIDRLAARLKRWFEPHTIVDRRAAVLLQTERWLRDYFAGRGADPSGIPLDLRGAPFERRVWEALLEIPAGTTRSYGAIAKQLSSPNLSRAVGRAVGSNPVSIIVPCHRVLGSTGALTGYGGGLPRKKALLWHERGMVGTVGRSTEG